MQKREVKLVTNTEEISPNQIITLNDYPLYSDKVLSEYFTKCNSGEIMAFVPVIKKAVVKTHIDDDIFKMLLEFEEINPEAIYFMLDGSHRTTALTLTNRKVSIIIYDNEMHIATKTLIFVILINFGITMKFLKQIQ